MDLKLNLSRAKMLCENLRIEPSRAKMHCNNFSLYKSRATKVSLKNTKIQISAHSSYQKSGSVEPIQACSRGCFAKKFPLLLYRSGNFFYIQNRPCNADQKVPLKMRL